MSESRRVFRADDPETILYNMDVVRATEREFPLGEAAIVFADPPFNQGEDYSEWNDAISRPKYYEFTQRWILQARRMMASHGTLWINVPDWIAGRIQVWCEDMANLTLANWCVWHFRFGQNQRSKFTVSKTHLLRFVLSKKHAKFRAERVLEPSDRSRFYADSRTEATANPGLRTPLDVWYGPGFSRVSGTNVERRTGHANQLPEAYLHRVISVSSDPGDLVVDLFAGSGTTQTVARAMGRRSIGFEIGSKEAASAWSRIESGCVRDFSKAGGGIAPLKHDAFATQEEG